MADETEDLGNDTGLIEGGEDIMGAIDSVLATGANMAPDATDRVDPNTVKEQAQPQETQEQKDERARNEKGQFTKEQQEEKERVEKANAEQKTQVTEGEKQYPAEIKSTKAREHFDALSKVKEDAVRRAESAESKLKQFETKIQELESRSGVAAPEVKVLQKENADLKAQLEEREKVISYKAVEETKAFREEVTNPQKEALSEITDIAGTYKLDGRRIDEILLEPSKTKRREMLEDLTAELPDRSQFAKEDLRLAIEKHVAAEGVARKLFENARGNREYAEQEKMQTEAKAALERQQAYQTANKEVDAIMKEKYPEIAGDETLWKEITEKAFKVADFDRMPPKAKAFANLTSWAFLKAMEKLRTTEGELKNLKEVAAKRNGALPSPTQGRAATTKAEPDEDMNGDGLGGLMSALDSQLGIG